MRRQQVVVTTDQDCVAAGVDRFHSRADLVVQIDPLGEQRVLDIADGAERPERSLSGVSRYTGVSSDR